MEPNPRKSAARNNDRRSYVRWRVGIIDDESGRRGQIAELVTALGATVVKNCTNYIPSLAPHVALVAVPAEAALAESSLLRIRTCRAAGMNVLAYAPGADNWPVAQKCRSLIAGAVRLIDATPDRLEPLLRDALGLILAGLTERANEDSHVRIRLRSLGVEGVSMAMLEVSRQLLRFAALCDLPVLVTGETGTGKERITRALHQCDPKRSAGPFVAVNCGALVSTLAESELFGHRRGAFTGAERSRPGLVRAADRGVLFLDEIGELDLSLQTKLLRVLQEGKVLGVGDEQETPVDVRIVAATHRNLHELVAAGKFRADLLHRLCVLPLHLPPLRERPDDIPVLVDHFLARSRDGKRPAAHSASKEFIEALTLLQLPGNVRQLENILRQAMVNKKENGPLLLADMPGDILAELATCMVAPTPGKPLASATDDTAPLSDLHATIVKLAEAHDWKLERCLSACEREVVSAALARMRGNQTQVAGLLGVTSRCVYNKLRKFGLNLK